MAISKYITNTSDQNHTTCPKQGSSELKSIKGVNDSDHPTTGPLENNLNPKYMTIQDWVDAQFKDKIISEIVLLFKSRKLCSHKINENDKNKMKQFIRQCNWLFMSKGILYHETKLSCPDRSTMQLVLPEAFRKHELQVCYDDLGHLRIEWIIYLLRDHFYWPGMLTDSTKHIKQCDLGHLRIEWISFEGPLLLAMNAHWFNQTHQTMWFGTSQNRMDIFWGTTSIGQECSLIQPNTSNNVRDV